MNMRTKLALALTLAVLIVVGCSKKSSTSQNSNPENQSATTTPPTASTNPEPAPPPAAMPPPETTPPPSARKKPKPEQMAKNEMPNSDVSAVKPTPPPPPKPIVIPAGTAIVVRLDQTISTKTATAGAPFTATVAQPIVMGGKTAVPTGSRAQGVVEESKSPGKFKGEGVLTVKLTKLTVHGITYPVAAESSTSTQKGKGKRSTAMIGGGAAGGALIGGLAGGGKGAAIGALVGGGAGTAGAAMTGNKDLQLPVETAVSFNIVQPITLKPQGASANATPDTEPPMQQEGQPPMQQPDQQQPMQQQQQQPAPAPTPQ
jgi:hypothetical protein